MNAKKYGLVISDLRMPEMNGYEFIRKVKEIKLQIKVFIMSAFDIDKFEFNRVLPNVKIDEFIQKPVSGKNLISLIERHAINKMRKESHREAFDKLDLPAGLKELAKSSGLTIEQLLNMKSSDVADRLGIDQDVARLIVDAVKL